jgi:hypothetical protein
MPTSPADPKAWRLLSTLALLVAILGLVLSASFGWIAFLLSGVFFAVELVLARRGRGAGSGA